MSKNGQFIDDTKATLGSKIAEHDGVNEDDLHVALLLSWEGWAREQIKTPVVNQQVPPTILRILGLEPNALDAVRKEQIAVLPFIFEGDNY